MNRLPKCKNCKERFVGVNALQKYCFKDECVKAWVMNEKPKQWKKEKPKRKEELKTLQDHINEAQKVFNEFIRMRDKGKPCISCGKEPKKANAGHFYNANNHWSVRFDESNVHLQCEPCNTNLSGNLLKYRDNLIVKIGYEEFERITTLSNTTRKFTIDEVKQIKEKYKRKVNNLKQLETTCIQPLIK